jgi:biopolymer transport protein ExbD
MEVASPIPKKHARIEIIPLIDIMFFLLASFMMVSLSQTTMKGMKVSLPTGSSGQTQSKKDYVSFSVDRDGYIYWDKTRINYEDVPTKLKPLYATNPDTKIFIRGDTEALHGNVTRLLDQIRSTGFTKIAFEIKSQASAGVPAPGK